MCGPIEIVFLLFPRITPLDAVGPYEVTRADVLVVSGGVGARAVAADERVLSWGQRIDTTTQWLLDGRRATGHWVRRDALAALGAVPVAEHMHRRQVRGCRRGERPALDARERILNALQ